MNTTFSSSTLPDINGERLWSSLMDMAEIGPTPKGGSRRLTLTDQDVAGRRLLLDWVEALGCTWQLDEAGNIFIHRSGEDETLAPVAIGSHLDTQPLGGRFDGVLGVLAGLEVLRTLHERNVTTLRPLTLVVWTNEEGSRFSPAMAGSGVWTGRLAREAFLSAKDSEGISVGEALASSRQRGDAPLGLPKLDAYFELHIEQGPVLEETQRPLGIVTGVQGIRWYDVRFEGEAVHAGPTPMPYRSDPLLAATSFIQAMREEIGKDDEGRFTIGDFRVADPSRNVVPGAVNLQLDVRHVDEERLSALDAFVAQLAQDAAANENAQVSITPVWHSPVTPFDQGLIDTLSAAAKERGIEAPCMMSGAGHDAVNLSHVTPTAMLFVPSRDGISHNEAEYTSPEHCTLGAQILSDAVIQWAQR
ncbi:M20 family metallo-hydrolase [Vreelandella sp. EE22]